MQQTLFNMINTNVISGPANSNTANSNTANSNTAKAGTGLIRWIACKWDMMAVVSLLLACAAYGVSALAHVV